MAAEAKISSHTLSGSFSHSLEYLQDIHPPIHWGIARSQTVFLYRLKKREGGTRGACPRFYFKIAKGQR